MKKKTIEGIPYLGLGKTSRKKEARYIGVTSIQIIGEEEHFFLEVYRNDKNAKKVPVARIVVTEKDFATFLPEEGIWSGQYIDTYGLIWDSAITCTEPKQKRNILQGTEDLERLKAFFHGAYVCDSGSWWQYVKQGQEKISREKRQKQRDRKEERRREALAERIAGTGALPEERITEYAETLLFHGEHYLFYKKRGSRAQVACSQCGAVTDGRWRTGESYESQLQRHIEEPIADRGGICPICGKGGIYKPQGRIKSGKLEEKKYVFLGQQYKESGLVMRYIQVTKFWELGFSEEGMDSAAEETELIEIARTYFEQGRKPQTDFQKYNSYSGETFWDDCNLYGLNNITIKQAPVMEETYGNIKGSFLRYSALKEYVYGSKEGRPDKYLELYQRIPKVEILVKIRLYGVVESMLGGYTGSLVNTDAERPEQFLMVRKERLKLLMENNGRVSLLQVLQAEKEMGQNWTAGQVFALEEIRATKGNIKLVLEVMTLQKALNRISKYAGCGYGTYCSAASEKLKRTAGVYFDYLAMRKQLGYDLGNTVYQQPRDLMTAHDKMVVEINKEKQNIRILQMEEKYPLIRKNYRKLRERYLYEDEVYIIRPARSAEEIILEGRTLHHCVGQDSYLEKHNSQKSLILMLRFKDSPEMPYITVELENGKIRQWYGAHDKKPDEKNMQKWLDAYVLRLRCGEGCQPGQEAGTLGA